MTTEQKVKAYDEALERASHIKDNNTVATPREVVEHIFPELRESEDKRIIQFFAELATDACGGPGQEYYEEFGLNYDKVMTWLKKQKEPEDKGEISDGYHTFNELYYYRMLYNAAFFNLLPKEWVHKSKKHHDGEVCFGGGWFIVMANLPTGQVSNHYELKDWDLFQIPEKEIADEWDGHTPQEAAERLHKYLQQEQPEVDLEKEIEKEWEKLEKDYSPSALDKSYIIVSGLVGEKQFSQVAKYFFDLGLNARK